MKVKEIITKLQSLPEELKERKLNLLIFRAKGCRMEEEIKKLPKDDTIQYYILSTRKKVPMDLDDIYGSFTEKETELTWDELNGYDSK